METRKENEYLYDHYAVNFYLVKMERLLPNYNSYITRKARRAIPE
jgi:hypothetical protein